MAIAIVLSFKQWQIVTPNHSLFQASAAAWFALNTTGLVQELCFLITPPTPFFDHLNLSLIWCYTLWRSGTYASMTTVQRKFLTSWCASSKLKAIHQKKNKNKSVCAIKGTACSFICNLETGHLKTSWKENEWTCHSPCFYHS